MLRPSSSSKALLILVTFALAGCFVPGHIISFPHVAGRVVDSATSRPIAGAVLQFEEQHASSAQTRADGHFDIPPISSPALYPVPLPDFYARWRHLVVRAAGYQPRRLSYVNYKSHTHETILLKRD